MVIFGIFLLRQNFIQIPRELDEAALIDGASYLGILLSIYYIYFSDIKFRHYNKRKGDKKNC